MTTATTGIGLRRLQHLVLWVSDVEQSVRFYRDVLGFEVKTRYPTAAFLKIPAPPTTITSACSSRPACRAPMSGRRACTTPPGRSARSPTSCARGSG